MMSVPRHFPRPCAAQELDRRMTSRLADPEPGRVREMNLYRRYFDLVAGGRKSIEVRVRYPGLRNLRTGDHIRFICGRDECLTQVRRVTIYESFEQMIDAEGPASVNPDVPRDQQLADIRSIYGLEKEALGVLAIEIERLRPPLATP
jgi:ASC-1-like (ASCH) protein